MRNIAIFAISAIVLAGCATTSGTKIKLDQAYVKSIDSLSVNVDVKQGVSVVFSKDQSMGTGAVMFGLTGLIIEETIRSDKDAKLKQALSIEFTKEEFSNILKSEITAKLEQSNYFQNVAAGTTQDYPVTYTIHILKWGFRQCVDRLEENLQATAEVSLILEDGGTKRFDRKFTYRDDQCYAQESFVSEEHDVNEVLTDMAKEAANTISMELLYP